MYDENWLETWSKTLAHAFDATDQQWSLYEPTDAFYSMLAAGNEDDLANAVHQLAQHVGLSTSPSVIYEMGLAMHFHAAGDYQMWDSSSLIRVPIMFVGKPFAVGAILAHELAHDWIAKNSLQIDPEENEPVTDLMAFSFGLGKLVLNGTLTESQSQHTEPHLLGYLKPSQKKAAYHLINRQRAVKRRDWTTNLNDNATKILSLGN